jgi:hypothetical protein
MPRDRILGLLSLLGGLLSLLLVVAFASTGFDVPGTAAYSIYETLNRLIALPLLLMACGWLGLALSLPFGAGRKSAWLAFAASVVMAAGTAAEFWLFSDQPYGVWANGRMISFLAFFIASLVLYICATLAGIFLWRVETGSRAGAAILMATIPLYIANVFTLNSNFLIPAALALVVGWVLLRLPLRNRVSGRNSVST